MPTATRSAARVYFESTRQPRYSLLFALPLLLLYEALAAALSNDPAGDIRNGADVILTSAFVAVAGRYGPIILMTLIVGACVWLIVRDMRRHGRDLRKWSFAAMFAESVLLAMVFGVVVSSVTTQILSPLGSASLDGASLAIAQDTSFNLPRRLMISLGAGLYEELLFRVILVGGLAWGGKRILGWSAWLAGTVAIVASAFIFSLFHYVGAYGDPFELRSFTFRLIAGFAFSGLYVLRGFGITAWTHALYDVFLLVL
jgi:hypothetical protein